MFIETRYYADGCVGAKIHPTKVAVANTNEYDAYIEECDTVKAFVQGLVVSQDEIDSLLNDLNTCEWVDISGRI